MPREIAPVVVTLNRLFQMLRTSVQSQQQFIANTAHQLRTPITGMQAQLDLLAAEPAAAPIKSRLATLQEAIRQLAHSANQLLTLARADPAINVASKNQAVSLKTIAEEVVAKFFDRALLARIDLGADVQPATVVADPSLLDDMLSNLVDNALKYTPSGGTVTVSTGERGGKALRRGGGQRPGHSRERARAGQAALLPAPEFAGPRLRAWDSPSSTRSRDCTAPRSSSNPARAAPARAPRCNFPERRFNRRAGFNRRILRAASRFIERLTRADHIPRTPVPHRQFRASLRA